MLTDTQIKSFKPKVKLYRKTDSNGLMLEIAISGSKLWRYRYRFNNRLKNSDLVARNEPRFLTK